MSGKTHPGTSPRLKYSLPLTSILSIVSSVSLNNVSVSDSVGERARGVHLTEGKGQAARSGS